MQAFSLVELCVVLAVLCVVFALSFPILLQGRERANSMKCLGNLRHWHVAIMGYANDHSGELPMNEVPGPIAGKTILFSQLAAPYGNFPYSYPNKDAFRQSVMACPSEVTLKNGIYTCYGLNIDLDYRIQGDKARVRLPSLTNMPTYVLMADTYANAILYTHTKAKMFGVGFSLANRRHGGFPNFLFADGHVVSYRDPIVGWGDPGGTAEVYKKLWFANGINPTQR